MLARELEATVEDCDNGWLEGQPLEITNPPFFPVHLCHWKNALDLMGTPGLAQITKFEDLNCLLKHCKGDLKGCD